ncbi:MAG TPA: nuclear transport factor 2 family protein [Acidimicrobiales bacterium]|nr:nuclear transport factor 2 family protein [Acidimicrobiales bacterium]
MTPGDLEAAVDGYVAAWNEPDPLVRAQLLAASVTDGFEFTGPTGTFRGREAVEGLIVALQSRLAGATVVRLGPVEDGTFRWAIVAEGGATLLEGVDHAEAAPDGRLTRISVAADPPSA